MTTRQPRRPVRQPAAARDLAPTPQQLAEMASSPMAFFRGVAVVIGGRVVRFGDVMHPRQVEWLESLAPALVAIARGEKPPIGRYFFDGTKGCGKDFILSLALLWLLCFSPRSLVIELGAASSSQAAEILQLIRQIIRCNRFLAGRVKVQALRVLNDATDSALDILPADSETAHGSRPDVTCINELAHIPSTDFAETMMDNASKVPHGLAVIMTNAGQVGSMAWKWRELARESSESESPRWVFHAMQEPAPWLDPAELDDAKARSSPGRFKRLFWGVWNTGADWIDEAFIKAAITKTGPLLKELEIRGNTFFMAVDAGVKRDRSALIVLAVPQSSGRVRLAWAEHWKPPKGGQIDLTVVEAAIRACHVRYNPIATYYDPSQMQLMASRLRRFYGMRMEEMPFTGGNLSLMADRMIEAFSSQVIDLYPFQPLIEDLGRITIEEKNYGQRLTAISGPDGHADLAVALSICLVPAMRIATGGRVEGMKERKATGMVALPNLIGNGPSHASMLKYKHDRAAFLHNARSQRGWRPG